MGGRAVFLKMVVGADKIIEADGMEEGIGPAQNTKLTRIGWCGRGAEFEGDVDRRDALTLCMLCRQLHTLLRRFRAAHSEAREVERLVPFRGIGAEGHDQRVRGGIL